MLINILLPIIKTTVDESNSRQINSISSTNVLTIKENIKNIKEEFEEIISDFETMDETFDKIFDYFINELKDKINRNKEITNEEITNEEITNLFLGNFLSFYECFSYKINKKISKINFNNLFIKSSSTYSYIKLQDIFSVKYLDLFYFINKLEKKISKSFNIYIYQIRDIIYRGYTNTNKKLIISDSDVYYFYKNVLKIRKANICLERKNIPSLKNSTFKEKLIDYVKKYPFNIFSSYECYFDMNEKTEENNKRFKTFIYYLKKIGINKENNNNNRFSDDDKTKIKRNIQSLKPFENEIRNEYFKYISYDLKSKFFDKFNLIKEELIYLIKQNNYYYNYYYFNNYY